MLDQPSESDTNEPGAVTIISRRFVVAVAVLGAIALSGWFRLWWIGRSVPEGWSTAVGSLADEAIGKFVETSSPPWLAPAKQFAYWNPRLERILSQHPNDAELHAAASLLMDQPCGHYIQVAAADVLRKEPSNTLSIGAAIQDRIEEMTRPFDVAATRLCLQHAKRATEIAPNDPRWWRVRVAVSMTQFRYSSNPVDRTEGYEQLLADAARHDPDNGIYELLVAAKRTDASFDIDADTLIFTFVDRDRFKQIVEDALAAINDKPLITIGEPAANALKRMHSLSGHPARGTAESLMSHSTSRRAIFPITQFLRNINHAGLICEQENDPQAARYFYQAAIDLSDALLTKTDRTIRNDGNVYWARSFSYRNLVTLDGLTPDEIDPRSAAAGAFIQEEAFRVAATQSQFVPPTAHWIPALAVACATGLLFGCLVVAPFLLIGVLVTRNSTSVATPWWSYVVLTSGLLSSVFFWGIGPAGLVAVSLQDCLLNILCTLALLLILHQMIPRQQRLQFGIRTLLLLCLVSAVGIQIVLRFGIGFPMPISPQPDQLLQAMHDTSNTDPSAWLPGPKAVRSCIMQWLVQSGPAVSVWITVALMALIAFLTRSVIKTIGIAFAMASVVSLISLSVWAWAYPSQFPAIGARSQQMTSYLERPHEYYRQVESSFNEKINTDADRKTLLETSRNKLQVHQDSE